MSVRILLFIAVTFDWILLLVFGVPLVLINRLERAVARFIDRLEFEGEE